MSFISHLENLGSWFRSPPRRRTVSQDPRSIPDSGFATSPPGSVLELTDPELRTMDDYLADSETTARTRIHRAFNAALPVGNRHGLTGRANEIKRLAEGMLEDRKHGIIFGPRGSGKTSLARVFAELADDAGHVVIYSSVSGDLTFTQLLRPFLKYLPGADRNGAVARGVTSLRRRDFNARALAGLLADVKTNTVLVLDEFDRVQNRTSKEEVASLLKLLSDMYSNVRLLLVGIAADVDDLILGHPSLRRHLIALPVGPISRTHLQALVNKCTTDAGMTIDDEVVNLIVSLAMGSPYHTRLFGMKAALAAEERGETLIQAQDVATGAVVAFEQWSGMSQSTQRALAAVWDRTPETPALLACIALVAAYSSAFTASDVTTLLQENMPRHAGWQAEVADLIAQLGTALQATGAPQQYMFQDTLAPQFISLMTRDDSLRPSRGADSAFAFPEEATPILQELKLS